MSAVSRGWGQPLRREGGPTAAAALRVGVLQAEAGPLQAVDVVELRPGKVEVALRVHEDLGAVGLEDLVGRLGLVELKLVREAGAAAAHDADAEALLGLRLGLQEIGQLGSGRLGERDHRVSPPLLRWPARRPVTHSDSLSSIGNHDVDVKISAILARRLICPLDEQALAQWRDREAGWIGRA